MSTFLITGANRGIGLELARQAAAAGHDVIAAVRDPARADALSQAAAGAGGRIEVIAMDVGDDASVAAAQRALGGRPIQTLINNAGVMGKPKTALDMDGADFLATLNVNVLGPMRVTRALLPNLRAAGEARVAVISSMMGSFNYPGAEHIGYSTSKTAINRLFHALARELQKDRIHVAILSPGWVRTDMGGPNATLSVEESAAGLLREIARTDATTSGAFRNYAGEKLAW
ncbi:MAG TPA: SDR family oxidoreductase [Beijerinckiaceae bacterium]|jgi:NAD(P)-dependent dehydrogenase (short-subunit alcohol dehydrogenase family)